MTRADYNRRYYAKHREELAANNRERSLTYYRNNRARILARLKRRRGGVPDKAGIIMQAQELMQKGKPSEAVALIAAWREKQK